MKVIILGKYHHKNISSLLNVIKILNFEIIEDINQANIIFSANKFIEPTKYPNKLFIFGPHFAIEPTKELKNINNIYNNVIYVQPSQPSINIWQNEYNFLNIPMNVLFFGVDIYKFKPVITIKKKEKVILYYKMRDPAELNFVNIFLKNNNIETITFNYNIKYNENDYIKTLQECKYGIWLGCHESQGFALEEALAMNIPLYVWSVTRKKQQYKISHKYHNIETDVSTVPYWNNECGEVVTTKEEFENNFNNFIKNVENNIYNPRNFIISNLTDHHVANNISNIIQKYYPS